MVRIDIKMEPMINDAVAGEALRLTFSELYERYAEAEQEAIESPEDKFISGRSLAFFEILEIINNRIIMANPRYENDD